MRLHKPVDRPETPTPRCFYLWYRDVFLAMEGEGRVSRVNGAVVVSSRRREAVTRDRQVGSKLVSRRGRLNRGRRKLGGRPQRLTGRSRRYRKERKWIHSADRVRRNGEDNGWVEGEVNGRAARYRFGVGRSVRVQA